jgi:HEAT repeat protein
MRKVATSALASALIISVSMALWGCHADPDDAAGQAGELTDPVRRENALRNIQRLYSAALAATDNDRESDQVKGVVDATIEKIAQAYLDYPEDTQNGRLMLDILKDMQDPRGLPAFKEALGWRPEVTEEHAITSAQALRIIEIPDGDKAEVIEKLADALERVTGARGVDNRMRIEFIRTLGELGDNRATPTLTKVATAQSEEQNFLINRLAATQIGRMGDAEAVPELIKCLFLFAPNNPAMRMNDVAAEALVRIGRPSYEPLLALMRGENEEAKAIVEAYIEAVRARDEAAAEAMSAEMLMNAEATFTLGALGYADAFDSIVEEAQSEDVNRRINASIALVRLNLDEAHHAQVRDILKSTYEAAELQAKPQLLAAMRMMYDAELLPFFLEQGGDSDLHPQVRIEAVKAYALLANESDAGALRSMIQREPASEDGGYKENFQQNEPLLALAGECNEDISCWIGKLGDSDKEKVKKAAYMLGRYGSGNDEAINALVGLLDHNELEVRLAALSSLDRIATSGSQAAVDKIEELRETEEGRSIWNNFSREALPTQARLRNRSAN